MTETAPDYDQLAALCEQLAIAAGTAFGGLSCRTPSVDDLDEAWGDACYQLAVASDEVVSREHAQELHEIFTQAFRRAAMKARFQSRPDSE